MHPTVKIHTREDLTSENGLPPKPQPQRERQADTWRFVHVSHLQSLSQLAALSKESEKGVKVKEEQIQ